VYIAQALKRAVQVNPEGLATADGNRRRTWREVGVRVAKLAGALRGAGVNVGERVAVLALNSDRYLETYFAAAWAGAVLVPLNVRLAPGELATMLRDVSPTLLLADDATAALLPKLELDALGLKVVFMGEGEAPPGAPLYEALLEAAPPLSDAEVGGGALATVLYTGGTSGRPKGVMLSHDNVMSNALITCAALYEGVPWTYLHAAPMFHIADCQWNTVVTMQGGTHAFIPKFTPEGMLRAVEADRVTHSCVVPTIVTLLCNALEARTYPFDVSSLRRLHYGGSPMPPAVVRRARRLLPHCTFSQGYGQTETSPNVSILGPEYHRGEVTDKLESAGRPVFAVEVKIVGEVGELPAGEVGEIVVRGPNVMKGYWNQPGETAHALRGGWLHTGDAGFLDERGFLYIVDRVKDMIVSGGENVYSAEVESVLYGHPAVAMCAVIGVPDETWGERVHAVVVPKEGRRPSEEELVAFVRASIAGYKVPRSVEVRDHLPMTGTGKVLKGALRAPFWEGRARRVN